MTETPDTRNSLLVRVRDSSNGTAWEEFAAIYRPMVYRLGLRCGLQHADSDDLAQRVLMSVAAAIGDWEKDETRGTFRGWLLKVARNAIINMVTRARPDAATGGTSMLLRLNGRIDEADQALDRMIEEEHRRAMFRWAAADVRAEFHHASWHAFQLTAIDGLSIEEAAAELERSVGSVYAARSRVMRRLKQKVLELDE